MGLKIQCAECHRTPDEIPEYVYNPEGDMPEDYVKENEGTYNRNTGKFFCTECYLKLGCPLGTVPSGYRPVLVRRKNK